MYGLLKRDLDYIIKSVSKYSEIEEVIIFGSRAMGNFKKASDIDLALKGDLVDRNILRRVNEDLNEVYPIPYFLDIINYQDISNEKLKTHIDDVGKSIWHK
ncbi:nucleotidyltransferase domain-containing protein [Helicovermis profundi]|uniref:Nucleotidyltransferase domain-containing protein n=1 Tax=Helicovermis profundi TaxID=3065157 RepID=A0AAU9EYX7_9FIRM|nr:nucleotidyltransferase domain-containing protein [Clostridia bacterium S502]